MTNPDHETTTQPIEIAGAPPVKKRRGVAVGLAGGLLAGTAAGLVLGVPGLSSAASGSSIDVASLVQQTDEDDSTTPTPAPSTEDGEAPAPAERGTRLRESLQDLVDDGTITAEQADAVVAKLLERVPERGDRIGHGHRGPGGHLFGRGVVSEALTDLLGLDAQELRQQLRDGATLAEIATTQGVEPQAVVDELVGELQERLDNAVENGRIEQADADEKLADATERITELVNNGRPERPERPESSDDAPTTED